MKKLLCALGLCAASVAQAAPTYSMLNGSGFPSGMASDSQGNILFTRSVNNGGGFVPNIMGGAYFTAFCGDKSAADICVPNLSAVYAPGFSPAAVNLVATGAGVSDGNRLGLAVASSGAQAEPGSLALAGLGLVLAGTAGRRAYRPRLKPTASTLGLRMSSSRGEGRVTLAS